MKVVRTKGETRNYLELAQEMKLLSSGRGASPVCAEWRKISFATRALSTEFQPFFSSFHSVFDSDQGVPETSER